MYSIIVKIIKMNEKKSYKIAAAKPAKRKR
jgi:hypothetical protein